MIGFAVQTGGGAGKAFRAYHPMLNRIFYKKELDTQVCEYFYTLQCFSIIFRVALKATDFNGGEGPEFLKKVRNKPIYTIDLTIPEHAWKGKSDREFRPYVADGVRQCFELLKQKALKNKEIKDLEKLERDFEIGIQQFLTQPLAEVKWGIGPFEKFPDYFIADVIGGEVKSSS